MPLLLDRRRLVSECNSRLAAVAFTQTRPDLIGRVNSKTGGGGREARGHICSLHFLMTLYVLYGIENTVVAQRGTPAEDCSNAFKPV